MLKAYKYRIYPSKKQKEMIHNHFGCTRYIYNKGLEIKIKEYQQNGKSPSYFDLATKMLKKEKKENQWLNNAYSQSLQMSLRNLDNAFQSFFRKQNKFPKFKSKKNNYQSYQLPQNVFALFDKNKIKLPKLGEVKSKFDRTFDGKIKTTTVSRTPTNKYFVSILVDNEKPLPKLLKTINKKTAIGIDLGIKDFCILSNEEKIANPRHLNKYFKRLKVIQKRASNKKKGSVNRKKANLKVAKIHEKITNRRKDFLHKLSSKIISENKAVILEDLNVQGMMKNHKLARHIGDASWSTFVDLLKYKAKWNGKHFVQIGRFEASSKTCSKCGWIKKDLTLEDREWKCLECKEEHDRDINAAINVRNFGIIKFKEYSRSERSGVPVEMPIYNLGSVKQETPSLRNSKRIS